MQDGKVESIRNPDGIWINTSVFREAGSHFMKHGYYTAEPWGSPSWIDFWRQERRRMIYGHKVGGAKITGNHYQYLNYCPIRKAKDTNKKKTSKITGFPDFWDGDFNYYWVREIAKEGIVESLLEDDGEKKEIYHLDDLEKAQKLKELFEGLHLEVKIEVDYLDGGYNLVVGKARRKGFSYKSAQIASNNFYTKPSSLTIFNAYEKKYLYPRGIMTMARSYINFMNENTGLVTPSDVVDKTDHIRASYEKFIKGKKIESGLKSEIMALTCKDNKDVNRGKDTEDIFVEEAGAFGTPGLLSGLYKASEDCVTAGSIKTGMITVFGTSGDLEKGTVDYANMIKNPKKYGMLPFINVWDKDSQNQSVGYFHPDDMNMEGFYDKQGNSDRESAAQHEKDHRARMIENGATTTDVQKRMQEHPLNISEAFSAVSVNNFPITEVRNQLQKIEANGLQFKKGTPVDLVYENGKVVAKPILDGSAEPITSYYDPIKDIKGCPIIYEMPVNDPPMGLYKIGYDPIRQDEGTSLASITVYKSYHKGTTTHNVLVAEYVGRLASPDDIDHLAEKFADLYNTQIMHENEVTSVKNYFRRRKRLNLLASQPDAVISKNIKKSRVSRVFGCHMINELKDAGERYYKEWLTKVLDYDENGMPITVIDRTYSKRLLEETIAYYRKGNFDMISSMFMCLFQVEEEEIGKEYQSGGNDEKYEDLNEAMAEMYH